MDFPGIILFLRVADEDDSTRDTAILVDDLHFLPEPGFVGFFVGSALLSGLHRARRRVGTVSCPSGYFRARLNRNSRIIGGDHHV